MSWLPKKCVVVPIDFSSESEASIRTALELAGSPENVRLLHVLYPLDGMSPGVVWGDMDDKKREAAVRKHSDQYFASHGFPQVTFDIRFGHPGEEIPDYARENSADLIVIPSHGRHGMRRFVLGSVAERVLRHSPCPVLVLRRRDADD